MALETLTIVVLICFYHAYGPSWIEVHWDSIWLWTRSHMTSHYTWGFVTTLRVSGGVLGWPLDTFFGLSQFHGHGSRSRMWSGPNKSFQKSPKTRIVAMTMWMSITWNIARTSCCNIIRCNKRILSSYHSSSKRAWLWATRANTFNMNLVHSKGCSSNHAPLVL